MSENLKEFVRISIGTEEENLKALTALKQVIA
jgi:histidinol-phosphate/aromatic aminotransferase/cobyric acid decarboxylase-like protein